MRSFEILHTRGNSNYNITIMSYLLRCCRVVAYYACVGRYQTLPLVIYRKSIYAREARRIILASYLNTWDTRDSGLALLFFLFIFIYLLENKTGAKIIFNGRYVKVGRHPECGDTGRALKLGLNSWIKSQRSNPVSAKMCGNRFSYIHVRKFTINVGYSL